VRAIRGATTASDNTDEAITCATQELLEEIRRRNALRMEEIVSVFFTLTDDLTAAFPARAARACGFDVPMLDMREVPVPGSLPRCIRVLIHIDRSSPVRHAYLREARSLRPDLEGQP
jgi:chorismate mutase